MWEKLFVRQSISMKYKIQFFLLTFYRWTVKSRLETPILTRKRFIKILANVCLFVCPHSVSIVHNSQYSCTTTPSEYIQYVYLCWGHRLVYTDGQRISTSSHFTNMKPKYQTYGFCHLAPLTESAQMWPWEWPRSRRHTCWTNSESVSGRQILIFNSIELLIANIQEHLNIHRHDENYTYHDRNHLWEKFA